MNGHLLIRDWYKMFCQLVAFVGLVFWWFWIIFGSNFAAPRHDSACAGCLSGLFLHAGGRKCCLKRLGKRPAVAHGAGFASRVKGMGNVWSQRDGISMGYPSTESVPNQEIWCGWEQQQPFLKVAFFFKYVQTAWHELSVCHHMSVNIALAIRLEVSRSKRITWSTACTYKLEILVLQISCSTRSIFDG